MRLNKFFLFIIFIVSSFILNAQHQNYSNADEVLNKLMEGNQRFVQFKQTYPNQNEARLKETAALQKPIAIIVGCSDSRVPPEIIFDQGIGDLFIIRNAGNVVDSFAIASIEYAVEHLGCKLIVVLGHERCGAVDATIKGGHLPGHPNSLTNEIKPSIGSAKRITGDLLTNVIYSNTKRIAGQISASGELMKEFIEKKGVKVLPAYYDLDSGKVELF